ncbi:MAG: U32 family peptidase, partial [Kiritimatiellae bacterium]|nr:U32 family peptidase [Kiritimatiellia bacterium]
MKLPELLLPAGNMSKLRMAIAYGADAVYIGANGLSMRPDESSFAAEELAEAVEYTHKNGCKLYVAINTLMYNEDFPLIKAWLEETSDISFDAVIVSDPGAFSLVQEIRPDMEIHISTQLSTANTKSASFWKSAGASRVVLARECTLAHAAEVSRDSGVEVEVFVHGAMCVAVSGRCLLSAHLCGKSGARGECKHSCRWEWDLIEKSRPDEKYSILETGRETILFGSTDLCMIEHIPQLVESGIVSLKVEGRMKSEYYVASVARVYRDALDRYAAA